MRAASLTAVAGTVLIGAGAFTLSFGALTDLARRSGFSTPLQSTVWALVVDGLILTATVAVVALRGSKAIRYAWTLLGCGATVSIAANVIHPLLSAGPVPPAVAASVALVPPLALLATTHLVVILGRPAARATAGAPIAASQHDVQASASVPVPKSSRDHTTMAALIKSADIETPDRASTVRRMRHEGHTFRQIADMVGVSERTARRDAATIHAA